MIKPLYLKYFTAIAIALSLNSPVTAQSTDTSLDSVPGRLTSEWNEAVLTHSLESATKIGAIKFSPDGKLLASVGASQITLWNLDKGAIQRVLPGHYASDIGMDIAPTAIAFSPDSRFIATSTWSQGLLNPDSSILVRDVSTGEEVFSISDAGGCRQVLFDPTEQLLYGACEFGVTAWSFPEGEELFSFDTEYPVEAIALSFENENKVMATVDANVSRGQQGEQSNQIQLWQLGDEQPKLLNTLDGHANDIVGLEFTADGKKLVSSSYDGKINVWNWQQGKTYSNTNNLYSKNGVFSLNANSKLIAGNFHSSTMSDLITGLPLRNAIELPDRVESNVIAFSPQDPLFATVENRVASNSVINIWSADNSQPEQQPHKDNYQAIPIIKYWINQEKPTVPAFEPELNKPNAIGKDPQAIALSALGLSETVESQQEEVELEYPSENLATVTITQANLADDSVAGIRYLVKFAPYGDRASEKWLVVWAGQQFKCRSGRGHQNWGTDLCQ